MKKDPALVVLVGGLAILLAAFMGLRLLDKLRADVKASENQGRIATALEKIANGMEKK